VSFSKKQNKTKPLSHSQVSMNPALVEVEAPGQIQGRVGQWPLCVPFCITMVFLFPLQVLGPLPSQSRSLFLPRMARLRKTQNLLEGGHMQKGPRLLSGFGAPTTCQMNSKAPGVENVF
jgi:hypothetical protein